MKGSSHEHGQFNSAAAESTAINRGKSGAGLVAGRSGRNRADGSVASGMRFAHYSPWRAGDTSDAADCAHPQHRCLDPGRKPLRRHRGHGDQQFDNPLVRLRNAAALTLPLKDAVHGFP